MKEIDLMKINSCQKCNSDNVKVLDDSEYAVGGYYCKCFNCGVYQKGSYSSKKDAIESWNNYDEKL